MNPTTVARLPLYQIATQQQDAIVFDVSSIATIGTDAPFLIFYLSKDDEFNGYGTVIQLDQQTKQAAIYADLNPEYTYLFYQNEQNQLQTLLWCIEVATQTSDGLFIAHAKSYGRGISTEDLKRFNQVDLPENEPQAKHQLSESYSASATPSASAAPTTSMQPAAGPTPPNPMPSTTDAAATQPLAQPQPAAQNQVAVNTQPANANTVAPSPAPLPTPAPLKTNPATASSAVNPTSNQAPTSDVEPSQTSTPLQTSSVQPQTIAPPVTPAGPIVQTAAPTAPPAQPRPVPSPPQPTPMQSSPGPTPAPLTSLSNQLGVDQPFSFVDNPNEASMLPSEMELNLPPLTNNQPNQSTAPASTSPVADILQPVMPPTNSAQPLSAPRASSPASPAPKQPVGRPPKPLLQDQLWSVSPDDFGWIKNMSRSPISEFREVLHQKTVQQIRTNRPGLMEDWQFTGMFEQAFTAVCTTYELVPALRHDILKALLNGRIVENIQKSIAGR